MIISKEVIGIGHTPQRAAQTITKKGLPFIACARRDIVLL
jgi:hypothetical protein